MNNSCHEPPKPPMPGTARIALVGNPNCGKSTLFNALTRGSAPVGNYAGTTVDRFEGALDLPQAGRVTVLDIPGTWSLVARSPEERIAFDAILGFDKNPPPDVLIAVVDAPRLARSLYLVLQLLELEIPVILACNLLDEARREGVEPNLEAVHEALGVPVVGIVARTGEGLDTLRQLVDTVISDPAKFVPKPPHPFPEAVLEDLDIIVRQLPERWRIQGRERAIALWLLLSIDDLEALHEDKDIPRETVLAARNAARANGRDLVAEIVGHRYAWIDARLPQFVPQGAAKNPGISEAIDRVLLHPISGTLIFAFVMIIVFEALFSWSSPAVDAIGAGIEFLQQSALDGFAVLSAVVPLGGITEIFGDLVANGVIAGVGSVIVFVPQIALLFFFIALLEDSGYLARAAHLMDRLLRIAGLPGRAFVPLLSGFACAVPAILATRTMPRWRDRLLTMAVLPLTSCSARLPVYALLIGALFPEFFPGTSLPARSFALFGMYLFSTVITLIAAAVLGKTILRDTAIPDLIELPPYRWPHAISVARAVKNRVNDFLREAGRVILIATVVLWALLTFPKYSPEQLVGVDRVAELTAAGRDVEAEVRPLALEQSFAGKLGHFIEPVIAPLGFDWQIGIGLIGAFAAREVFVATMGIVYGVGDEVDENDPGLRERLRTETRSDGKPRYSLATATSLMVFFALGFQCLSTLAVLRRETRGWRWPIFIVTYMTVLAWGISFAVYQVGSRL